MKRRIPGLSLVLTAALLCVVAAPGGRVRGDDVDTIVGLLELLIDADADSARKSLGVLRDKVQSREIVGAAFDSLRSRLVATLDGVVRAGAEHPLYGDAVVTLAALREPRGLEPTRRLLNDGRQTLDVRRQALEALVFAGDAATFERLGALLADPAPSAVAFRPVVLGALGRSEDPRIADTVLAAYAGLDAVLQPKAVELLTQRPVWSRALLGAIERKQIAANALNANQVARLLASRDEQLVRAVRAQWGSVRMERNPQRELVIAAVRKTLAEKPGDPRRGQQVFQKVCGQCHKIHGAGQEVGPDITLNGRASFDQLLSNVLDPSLVIGASYQARTVVTSDGRVLTGLSVEDSEQRIVLKMQGGKVETIARDDVEETKLSPLSLMPEGLETQLPPQELIDLFWFLCLDKPPDDPAAKFIAGSALARP